MNPTILRRLSVVIAIVVIASFNSGKYLKFPPDGFSLRWYANFFRLQPFMDALLLSFVLAVVAAAIATAIVRTSAARAALDECYRAVAALVRAAPRNIAVASSATAAYAQALLAFDFAPGDAIVTTVADYLSNRIMFEAIARRRGVRIVEAPDLPEGGVDPDAVAALIRAGQAAGVAVVSAPRVVHEGAPVSSTRIRGLLETGEIAAANVLLGYPYFARGVVAPGKQLGRKLGFPTLNLDWGPDARARIVFDPRGGIVVTFGTFQDRQFNGRAFFARSTDGGASFTVPRPRRISTACVCRCRSSVE